MANYIVKKDIHFYDSVPVSGFMNKLIKQESFSFPTEIYDCIFMITQGTFLNSNSDGTGLAAIGSGVENISYKGTDVYFTAWMQFLDISGTGVTSYLSNNVSYLTVQAIAEIRNN